MHGATIKIDDCGFNPQNCSYFRTVHELRTGWTWFSH